MQGSVQRLSLCVPYRCSMKISVWSWFSSSYNVLCWSKIIIHLPEEFERVKASKYRTVLSGSTARKPPLRSSVQNKRQLVADITTKALNIVDDTCTHVAGLRVIDDELQQFSYGRWSLSDPEDDEDRDSLLNCTVNDPILWYDWIISSWENTYCWGKYYHIRGKWGFYHVLFFCNVDIPV